MKRLGRRLVLWGIVAWAIFVAVHHWPSRRLAAEHASAEPGPGPLSPGVEVPTRDFLAPLTEGEMEKRARTRTTSAQDGAMLPWAREIVAILQDPALEGTKGERILALLPTLPEEALQPAMEQALPLVADADYETVVGPLLLNAQTQPAVLTEMFRDLMDRPENLTLPTLLALAKMPEHPLATASRENLTVLLGEDAADDFASWEEAIRQRLAATPPP